MKKPVLIIRCEGCLFPASQRFLNDKALPAVNCHDIDAIQQLSKEYEIFYIVTSAFPVDCHYIELCREMFKADTDRLLCNFSELHEAIQQNTVDNSVVYVGATSEDATVLRNVPRCLDNIKLIIPSDASAKCLEVSRMCSINTVQLSAKSGEAVIAEAIENVCELCQPL